MTPACDATRLEAANVLAAKLGGGGKRRAREAEPQALLPQARAEGLEVRQLGRHDRPAGRLTFGGHYWHSWAASAALLEEV